MSMQFVRTKFRIFIAQVLAAARFGVVCLVFFFNFHLTEKWNRLIWWDMKFFVIASIRKKCFYIILMS